MVTSTVVACESTNPRLPVAISWLKSRKDSNGVWYAVSNCQVYLAGK